MDGQKREAALMIGGVALVVVICAVCYFSGIFGGDNEVVGRPSNYDAAANLPQNQTPDSGSPASSFAPRKPKSGSAGSTFDVGSLGGGSSNDPSFGVGVPTSSATGH